MRRKIPSTHALTAFEAAARHQSFTRAADELALTQSAVCRQIAALERFVDVKLFRRTRRGILLTEAGARFSQNVRARLDEVERDTLAVMANGGAERSLELGVMPTFATRWLLPRLPAFKRDHPGITLHLTPRVRPFSFEETALDAALHAGYAGWPGTESTLLMHEQLIAVGSPALVGARKKLKPADLTRFELLQATTRPYAWRRWFESVGVRFEGDLAGPRMELFSMMSQAAMHGLGIALVPRFLVEDELADGSLVQLTSHSLFSDRSYYLIWPERRAHDPTLAAFKAWVEGEAKAYRDRAGAEFAE
ncbi:LysR family transcriptional regulator [Piscinibacter koreensis]|uniref:LysR family transcriptional regulator n=1 Tax=Piscinibacter koreensis TaxID=2742824 RepID=A0A7Y6NKH4_9BURK|nr:LysR family transcriptional regulator [Schlegelella koreensis]NUZ04777.1 LysR family transcriptional regulator [Schlegelella koreensis]